MDFYDRSVAGRLTGCFLHFPPLIGEGKDMPVERENARVLVRSRIAFVNVQKRQVTEGVT